jgi:hypothetical protein
MTPGSSQWQVTKPLPHDSISTNIIDVWIGNRRLNGKPWSVPLPPPRQSLTITIGDAIARASMTPPKKGKSAMTTKQRDQSSTGKLFARPRRSPSLAKIKAVGDP